MSILGGGMPGKGSGGGPKSGSNVPMVSERDFEREVFRSEIPVLIEFSAEWCAPCKKIAPEVEAFAREVQGKIKVVKIDVDQSPRLARELRVQNVPTFMLFADQQV